MMDDRETRLGAAVRDEVTLVDALKRREPQAFTTFFDTHVDRVYRIAAGILGNDADAQDVVQATFLSAFEAIERFESHAQLGTWLYRIAYNHALMLARRRHPSTPLPGEEDRDEEGALPLPSALLDWSALPEDEVLGAEAQEALRAAIAELPPSLRAAFVLRDVEGLSTADCAQVQELSEGACKVRLHRARLALRERLSAYFGERLTAPAHAHHYGYGASSASVVSSESSRHDGTVRQRTDGDVGDGGDA